MLLPSGLSNVDDKESCLPSYLSFRSFVIPHTLQNMQWPPPAWVLCLIAQSKWQYIFAISLASAGFCELWWCFTKEKWCRGTRNLMGTGNVKRMIDGIFFTSPPAGTSLLSWSHSIASQHATFLNPNFKAQLCLGHSITKTI